jgi:hypothetical protein
MPKNVVSELELADVRELESETGSLGLEEPLGRRELPQFYGQLVNYHGTIFVPRHLPPAAKKLSRPLLLLGFGGK